MKFHRAMWLVLATTAAQTGCAHETAEDEVGCEGDVCVDAETNAQPTFGGELTADHAHGVMPARPKMRVQCGNGALESHEHCDDGNLVADDGCDRCRIEPGYACSGAPSMCVGICGDGLLVAKFEQCDDGNVSEDDGCNSDCHIETGWLCDDSGCWQV
jgi:cysteine-rich repeat protein